MNGRRARDTATPQVAVVETAAELEAAVEAGKANIQIRRHLDLRDGRPTRFIAADGTDIFLPPILGNIPPTVITIRV